MRQSLRRIKQLWLALAWKKMRLNKKMFSTISQKSLGFGEWKVLKSLKSHYGITQVLMPVLGDADT